MFFISTSLVAGLLYVQKNHIPLFPTGSFSASCGFYLYMRVALTSIGVSWVTACQRGSLVLVPISCAIFLLYKTPESSAPVHYSSSPRASVCLPHPVSTVGLAQFPTGLKNNKQKESVWAVQGLVMLLQQVHDEVVHLVEHHKVDGQTGAAVLCGRITGQPGEGVVLLQHKPVGSTQHL